MATAELKLAETLGRKIDAKRAAQLALKYFHDLFPNEQGANMALEEVEFSEDEKFWLITLSHHVKAERSPKAGVASMQALFGPATDTKYKVFKVDAHTGKVISMKIRKFE